MWVILEGIDRSGKSTIAEIFKRDGFEIVHLNAPDKKYSKNGYVGPSYADEMLDILMKYDGKDVVFDRSWYGELVWPHVYGRKPLLDTDDLEVFEDYEQRNATVKYLLVDADIEAHWKRCVDNKEPLDRGQFVEAGNRYSKLAHEFGFIPRELGEFSEKLTGNKRKDNSTIQEEESLQKGEAETIKPTEPTVHENQAKPVLQKTSTTTPLQEKLEKANAINSILSKKIIKQKGEIFESIEEDIKLFLKDRLSEIMGTETKSTNGFSNGEVQMLKTLCKQWQSKLKG